MSTLELVIALEMIAQLMQAIGIVAILFEVRKLTRRRRT